MALGSTRAIRRITIFYFLPSIERSVASIERVSPTRARASSHAVPRERTSHAVPPTNGRRRDARRRSRPLRARVFPRILEIIGSPIDRESRRDDDAPPRRVRDDVGVQGSSARPRAPRSSIVRAATPTRRRALAPRAVSRRRRARPRDRRDRCHPIDRAGKKKKCEDERSPTPLASRQSHTTQVAVLGAAGGIGQSLSLLLKMNPMIAQLNLYDIQGTPGVAADLRRVRSPRSGSHTTPSAR
jgi:hypothetical protein